MGSLYDLHRAVGSYFRLYERDVSSSLRLTRNPDLKTISGFCTKPQVSLKAPSYTSSCRTPGSRFKKEDEIPETVSFEMLDAAKNKMWGKISFVMIALTAAGCISMIVEGKKAKERKESLTSLTLEKKALLREAAAMAAKTE
uniref:Protein FAM162A n=1 Tax=Ursus maritimus TaxID=29073 RepID=A0A452UQ74_URSMA